MATTNNLGLELLGTGRQQPEAVIDANMQIIDAMLGLGNAADVGIFADLIAFWPLDEASGTRYDKVGANNLTDNNTVTGAVGKRSPASQFTAANSEYLSIADNVDLSTGDINFTITFWAYLDSKTTDRDLVTKWGASGNFEYILSYGNSADRFIFNVSSTGSNAVPATANTLGSPSTATWYFIVAYHNKDTNLIGISVNNGAFNTAAHSTGVFNSTAAFQLGARASSPAYHDGRMERVRFYKRILTAAELTYLYNSGKGDPLWV